MLAAAFFWLCLGQDSFWQVDAQEIVRGLAHGGAHHDRHVLYPIALNLFHAAVAPFGVGPFRTAVLASTAGAVVFLACLARMLRSLNLPPRERAFVVAGTALCPGVTFFATLPEFHGPFLAAAGLAYLAQAARLRRPQVSRAVVLGLATGFASGMHGTGHLLLPLFLLWNEDGVGRPRARIWLPAATAHLVFASACALLLRGGAGPQWALLAGSLFRPPAARHLFETVLFDGILPFAPFSVAALVPLGARAQRLPRRLPAAAAGYLLLTWILVREGYEFGAYLLPLAPLLLLRVTASTRGRARVALLALGLAGSMAAVFLHDRPADPPGLEAALSGELRAGRDLLLVGTKPEIDLVCRDRPELDILPVWPWLTVPEATLETLPALLATLKPKEGRLLLGLGARDLLRERAGTRGRRILSRLRQAFAFVPVRGSPYPLWRLEARR